MMTEKKLDIISMSDDKKISIKSDLDFIKFKFPGNGTGESPYRIEKNNLIKNNPSTIIIENTNMYFIIKNFNLTNSYNIKQLGYKTEEKNHFTVLMPVV